MNWYLESSTFNHCFLWKKSLAQNHDTCTWLVEDTCSANQSAETFHISTITICCITNDPSLTIQNIPFLTICYQIQFHCMRNWHSWIRAPKSFNSSMLLSLHAYQHENIRVNFHRHYSDTSLERPPLERLLWETMSHKTTFCISMINIPLSSNHPQFRAIVFCILRGRSRKELL